MGVIVQSNSKSNLQFQGCFFHYAQAEVTAAAFAKRGNVDSLSGNASWRRAVGEFENAPLAN